MDPQPSTRPGTPSRRPVLLAAAAVGAVVLAVVIGVWLLSWDEPGDPPPTAGSGSATDATAPSSDPSSAAAGSATPPPPGWRTESFRGLSVSVPVDWAVGGSPMDDGGSAGLVDCGVGAGLGQAYVGRPARLTEQCTPLDPESVPVPGASYIWFDSPVAPSVTEDADGFTAETVEVGGQRVTVSTDDATLRAELLASVRPVVTVDDNGCPVVQPDDVEPMSVQGETGILSMCVYERTASTWELLWSGQRDPAVGRALVDAIGARTPEPGECQESDGGVRLQVFVGGADADAAYVVSRACRTLLVPGGALPLDDALTSPWSAPAVDLYSPPLA